MTITTFSGTRRITVTRIMESRPAQYNVRDAEGVEWYVNDRHAVTVLPDGCEGDHNDLYDATCQSPNPQWDVIGTWDRNPEGWSIVEALTIYVLS